MTVVAALYRHPVKGFTPEPLTQAILTTDGWFPGDRMWAMENGPSGYDPGSPEQIPKQAFTVLMRQAMLARVRTCWDEATNILTAEIDDQRLCVRLDEPDDGAAFATVLADFLGEEALGPLRLIAAGPSHRFMDSSKGRVSILNLNSVRDLERRLGQPLDPLRFRANIWIEGLEPWVENDWSDQSISIGETVLRGAKPTVRCAAIDVDPATGVRDLEVVRALFDNYGHVFCGLYVSIETGGRIVVGDPVARPA
ncbi:MAG TPA: MOSC domain-containing protein [Brevundimonas sp.]|jgi:hypothetical protein